MKSLVLGVVFAALFNAACTPAFWSSYCPYDGTGTFQSGTGTLSDPYIVCTTQHFRNIETHASSHFRLGKNLSFVGQSFTPITALSGSFHGGDFTLSGISYSGTANAGLFSTLTGTVQNLNISASITLTGNTVGLLAATASAGAVISNVTTSGSVSTAGSEAGGLIGIADGALTISNCSSSATVVATTSGAGGLIGGLGNGAVLTTSSASGTVTCGADCGGLVGFLAGTSATLSNTHASGSVTSTGAWAGGLIGRTNVGTITDSYATGEVSSLAVGGGLIGATDAFGVTTVSRSYATGDVTVGGVGAGGFVGVCDRCFVSDSYARGGRVAGTDGVGGFVGVTLFTAGEGLIERSYSAAASVISGAADGGFVASDFSVGAVVDETSCFWDSDLVAAVGVDGTGQSTINMQTPATFLGVGFLDSIWKLSTHAGGYVDLR